MRTVIIGDIHGCVEEFTALLDQVKLDTAKDRLILLGDILDRGHDTYGVLMQVLHLKSEMKDRLIYLMGNHEDLAVDAILNGDFSLWNYNGGGKTRKSFYRAGSRIQKYVGYLKTLPLFFETEDLICVHAGISPGGLDKTSREVLLWDREIAYGGSYTGKLLVYGHTPTEAVMYRNALGSTITIPRGLKNELPKIGSICLDTGCVYGGRLSAMVITDGYYQIYAVAKQ